jgi:NTE family protein
MNRLLLVVGPVEFGASETRPRLSVYPEQVAGGQAPDGPVGLVLAGGGARGAYEVGALSVLLPALEERGQRPRVIVGTSVGALNAAYLASTAQLPASEAMKEGRRIWTEIHFAQVLEPVASVGALRRLSRYVGQFLGFPRSRLEALLDPGPLRETLLRLISFDQIERNLGEGGLDAAAVVATSAATSRTIVFHCGGGPPAHDDKRGIDYVEARLTDEHVRASAAIPGAFPAVHVLSPPSARGWYFDGGTRLNTPIKPALALGAKRIVVIALNSLAPAPPQQASDGPPDALEGASQLVQAVLVDPLVHDIQTLATVNTLIGDSGASSSHRLRIPYVLIAPQERDAIGNRAQEIFEANYSNLSDSLRARDLAFLGRAVAGGSDAIHGELLSYLFFAPEFAESLIRLGREDARRWLDASHEQDLWDIQS